ncbi:MAG: hypothetical protein ACTHQQ_12370 [Solirubrobacteraceae bacterium]
MTFIIILNAVFAAFVVVGIVGLHLYAIAKDHAEHAGSSLVRAATNGRVMAPARDRRAGHDRVAQREIGAVSVPRRAASGQALS